MELALNGDRGTVGEPKTMRIRCLSRPGQQQRSHSAGPSGSRNRSVLPGCGDATNWPQPQVRLCHCANCAGRCGSFDRTDRGGKSLDVAVGRAVSRFTVICDERCCVVQLSLSCSLCVLGSRADLVRAAQLRPELAAEYAELEAEIGHRFRNDLSMAEIITAAEQTATAEHTEETATIELGQGQLWWPRFERQSDRYGTVFLLTGPDAEDYVSFENAPVGQPGRLVAIVVKTRRSEHCGDIARSLAPVTPTVGEEITLGAGTLFTDTDADLGLPTAVGLAPDDHRDSDWLDPRALYRCHNQTVRLELCISSHANRHPRDTRPCAA